MTATLTPEQAREMLQAYIDIGVQEYGRFRMPIKDVIVLRSQYKNGICDYTWRSLMATAYNLTENNESHGIH